MAESNIKEKLKEEEKPQKDNRTYIIGGAILLVGLYLTGIITLQTFGIISAVAIFMYVLFVWLPDRKKAVVKAYIPWNHEKEYPKLKERLLTTFGITNFHFMGTVSEPEHGERGAQGWNQYYVGTAHIPHLGYKTIKVKCSILNREIPDIIPNFTWRETDKTSISGAKKYPEPMEIGGRYYPVEYPIYKARKGVMEKQLEDAAEAEAKKKEEEEKEEGE